MTEPTILQRIMDSRDRTVGGGSAAALAGGMAAGLAGLVARLSESGEFGLSTERCRALAEEADRLAALLQEGAEADARAYLAVVTAYRMPADPRGGDRPRRDAVERAVIGAAETPRDNARAAARVRELCAELEGGSNPNASSDLAVAILLAETAVLGCVYNIEINLPLVESEAAAAELRRDADELRARVAARARREPTEEGR